MAALPVTGRERYSVRRPDAQQFLTGRVIDLQRRVPDAEAFLDEALQLAPAGMAVVAGSDEDVRGQRGEARRHLPDVQVVHLDDARRRSERAPDVLRIH